MIDKSPVDKIGTVIDGDAREIFKGRSDEEVIGSDSDHAWIRVEPWNHSGTITESLTGLVGLRLGESVVDGCHVDRIVVQMIRDYRDSIGVWLWVLVLA